MKQAACEKMHPAHLQLNSHIHKGAPVLGPNVRTRKQTVLKEEAIDVKPTTHDNTKRILISDLRLLTQLMHLLLCLTTIPVEGSKLNTKTPRQQILKRLKDVGFEFVPILKLNSELCAHSGNHHV